MSNIELDKSAAATVEGVPWRRLHRVSELRSVRVRPYDTGSPQDVVYVVDFEILHEENGAPEPEIHGSVKWDGCSNWGESDNCLVHMCGPDEGAEIAACLRMAYALAHDIMGERANYTRPDVKEWGR